MRRVAQDTESHFRDIYHIHKDRITGSATNTVFYSDTTKELRRLPRSDEKKECSVTVIRGDTIDVSKSLLVEGYNPLVLNMASNRRPGGGWRNGAVAQEETLFYRSTYAISLENCMNLDKKRRWRYPIPVEGAIYTPDVFIFRAAAPTSHLYKWEDCVWLSFVAVPAIRRPRLKNGHMSGEAKRVTKMKMRGIFKVAKAHGHDSVVLGAMGCGAYGNPATDIAALFKEVIEECHHHFKKIVFAIYDDKNAKRAHNSEGNLVVFKRVFSKQ